MQDKLQIRKCSAHCNRRWHGTLQLPNLLKSWDIISLFLKYWEYHLIGKNISTHGVKYFLCRHRHGFLMSMTCQHNYMSKTALIQTPSKPVQHSGSIYQRVGVHNTEVSTGLFHLKLILPLSKAYSKSSTGGVWISNGVAECIALSGKLM